MTLERTSQDPLKDGIAAVSLVSSSFLQLSLLIILQVARLSWRRSLAAWVYVPTGLVLVLLVCFGVNSLISIGSISFPASVACMILLFFSLIGSELALGDKKTRSIVRLIDIPVESLSHFHVLHMSDMYSVDLRYVISIYSSRPRSS